VFQNNDITSSSSSTMVGRNLLNLVVCSLLLAPSGGQAYDEYVDYGGQDYPQDNLYHDYAVKQQEKEVGA